MNLKKLKIATCQNKAKQILRKVEFDTFHYQHSERYQEKQRQNWWLGWWIIWQHSILWYLHYSPLLVLVQTVGCLFHLAHSFHFHITHQQLFCHWIHSSGPLQKQKALALKLAKWSLHSSVVALKAGTGLEFLWHDRIPLSQYFEMLNNITLACKIHCYPYDL